MTFGRFRCVKRGGTTECGGHGSRCIIRIRTPGVEGEDEEENFFIHTEMTEEEREHIHDDTLVKLTDDINKLIREAEKKRPDKYIGIMFTTSGLFFRYGSKTPPSKEWLEKAMEITDENVQQLLKLTPK
jgi:hypothetical protein